MINPQVAKWIFAIGLAGAAAPSMAGPAFNLGPGDLKSAMSDTLAAVSNKTLAINGDSIRYELDDFKVDLYCHSGWMDVSQDYSSNTTYYQCEGALDMAPVAGGAASIVAMTLDTYQVIVGDNGEFFGEVRAVPNLDFGGADFLTDNMNGSRFAFAVAKGAILNDYADIAVGLPDNRIMAFFDLSYTDGGKLAVTDSIEASFSNNSFSFKFVLDWNDPLYYFETDLFTKGPFDASPVQLTAQGLSYHGRLGFAADYPLWDGDTWAGASWNSDHWKKSNNFEANRFEQNGHFVIGGTVKFQPYPIAVDGLFNVNFDANNDGFGGGQGLADKIGKTLMEIAFDTSLAGNGALKLDLGQYAGLQFEMKLGEGSLNFNTAKKSFSFWAESVDLFSGGAANQITKLMNGIKSPEVLTYGHIDVDKDKIASLDTYMKADLSHNGFLLKGSQAINYNTPGMKDGLLMDGRFGYKGADIGFKLAVTSNSCKTTIDSGQGVNIGGYNVDSVSIDLCKALDGLLVPISGIINVAGEAINVVGNTSATVANTLSSAANQTLQLTEGSINQATVELTESGVKIKNAVASFGDKAKQFFMGTLDVNSAGNFSKKLSSYISKNGLSTGDIGIGGGKFIASQSFKIYGDGKYRAKVEGQKVSSEHVTQLKVKYCAKVKVKGLGSKQTCKTDNLSQLAGGLDKNGCFNTPSLSKSLKLLGIKVKFPIPSKKLCMF